MGAQDKQLWLGLLARPLAISSVELNAMAATLTGEEAAPPPSQQDAVPIRTIGELATVADSFRQKATRLDQLVAEDFALSPEGSFGSVSPVELMNQPAEVQREQRRLATTVHRLAQAAPKPGDD